MIKNNAFKLAATVAMGVSIVALSACDKKQEQPIEAEIEVVEPVVQEIEAVCDEPSLRNRLVDAIQMGLLDSAMLSIQNYNNATRLGLEQQVRQKLSEIDIDLKNVAASGAMCHADVHFTLSAQDIAYANKTFRLTNQFSFDEQAVEVGAMLVGDNRVVVKGFAYTIDNNKAIIGTDNAIINLLADTLTASAYSMAGESRTNAQNTPTVRLEPVQPIATPRINQSYDEEVPQVQIRQETAEAKAGQSKAQSPKPKTQPQPAENAPTPKPVVDENVELTIVESDDTY